MDSIHVTFTRRQVRRRSPWHRDDRDGSVRRRRKTAIAAKVDGRPVDLNRTLDKGLRGRIGFCRTAAEGLDVLRHSTAHLMAQAVQSLFPGTQVTIGPTIEDGFYYDFKTQTRLFHRKNWTQIEKRMQELAKANLKVTREEMPRSEAIELFRKMGEDYKVQIIEGITGGNGFALSPRRLGRSLPRAACAEHGRDQGI